MSQPGGADLPGREILHPVAVTIFGGLISALVGYPVAYFVARKVHRFRMVLLMLVILPLWTSYLVRTFAWRPPVSRGPDGCSFPATSFLPVRSGAAITAASGSSSTRVACWKSFEASVER